MELIPGAIFGPDPLLIFGADTITTATKEQVIYSCEQCIIFCTDSKGSKKWSRNIACLDCRLEVFSTVYKLSGEKSKKHKGFDIVLQLKNKKIYGLKSKNGKIKYLGSLNPHPGSRKHPKRTANNLK